MVRSSVDLPQPEGPGSVVKPPTGMSNVTPSRAGNSPSFVSKSSPTSRSE